MSLEVHPAAAVFPMQSESELKEMAKSITAFGLREKIGVIDEGGKTVILDGRNRFEALKMVGVKEDVILREFCTLIDLSKFRCTPEEYVLMANIERRNLTGAQRRALAGKLAVMLGEKQKLLPKEQKEDSLTKAAELAGVSRRTAAIAKKQVLVDAGKTPAKPKPTKKAPGGGLGASQVLATLQKSAEALTRSGHNFAPESLNEIALTATNMANIARQRIQLIAERAAEAAQKAAEEAARAAAETDADEGNDAA